AGASYFSTFAFCLMAALSPEAPKENRWRYHKFLAVRNPAAVRASIHRPRKAAMHGSKFGARDRLTAFTASIRMPRLTSNRTNDERAVAEECPVALVYDGTTVAVLMATPGDLTDLGIGFSLTEGIIKDVREIEELNVVAGADGIE